MRILMNLSEDKLNYFSKMSGHTFAVMSSTVEKDTVAVIVEDGNKIDKFQTGLIEAVVLGLPVVIIAGSKQTANPFITTATENGIPGDCVIVKDGDQISSATGHIFGKAQRGISVHMLCTICEYVLKNDLRPEILIWEEKSPEGSQIISTTEPVKPKEQPAERYLNQETGHINAENLNSILALGENILAVFKTIPESNSGIVANKIAGEINAIHLEVSDRSSSFKYYGNTLNDAIQSGRYAYSTGETVQISSRYSGGQFLVVEFDPKAPPEAMGVIYEKCQANGKIIHTAPDLKMSKGALEAWLEPGYQLDAIIPEEASMLRDLKTQFGDCVCDINTLIQRLR